MIGKTIKSILAANTTLTALIPALRMYPYVMNEDTTLPALVYTIDSVDPTYTKKEWVNDVIEFSALGYKTSSFTIPDSLYSKRYTCIQVMTSDTMFLSETVIYPWPTIEEFKKAFVEADIPNDDQQRAMKNLELAEMKERMMNMPMDGSQNYKNYIDQQIAKNYYNGQYQPISLLNPIAWAKFIQAWKEGKFKRKNK